MVQAADARRAVRHLALVRANVFDEFLQRMNRQILIEDQRKRIGADVADWRKILQRVVTHLLDRGHNRHYRQRCEEKRIAIRRRLGDKIGSDSATCAGFILDDERLAKSFVETLRSHAGETVRIAASCKRHDDCHRPLRPGGLR